MQVLPVIPALSFTSSPSAVTSCSVYSSPHSSCIAVFIVSTDADLSVSSTYICCKLLKIGLVPALPNIVAVTTFREYLADELYFLTGITD